MKKLLIILVVLAACCNYTEQFLRGYYYDTMGDGEAQFELVKPIIITAIREFEDNFGWCDEEIFFIFREYPFYCYGQLAGGCVCGYNEAISLCIGVDPNDECMTAYIVLHEMYHVCEHVLYDDVSWINQLEALKAKLRGEGKCRYDPAGLYDPYPFK